MKIYKSPTTDLFLCDYTFRAEGYRSVAPMVFFKLTTGTIIEAHQGLKAITEKFPTVILDSGMPKPNGEWSVYGDAIRSTLDVDHSLIEITVGSSQKTVLVDYTNKYKLRLSLDNNLDSQTRFFLYKKTLSGYPTTKLIESFTDLALDDENRLPLAGSYDKEYLIKDWPNLPRDFNFAYNCVAPKDQRIEGYWHFGDYYSLTGVVPALYGLEVQGKLPSIDLKVYMHKFMEGDKQALMPATLNLDTIKFFPDVDVGVMIWHCVYKLEHKDSFDTLLVLDGKDLSTTNEKGELVPPSDIEILKLAIAQHPPKQDPGKPTYTIEQKVTEVQSEARAVKHTRFCNIYLDYYRCLVAFDKFPDLMPLMRDRVGKDLDIYTNMIRMYEDKTNTILDQNSDLKLAVEGKILPTEKNFASQLSAVLYKGVENNQNPKFLEFMKEVDLRDFSMRRYLIGYLPKPQTHKYSDWGIEAELTAEFTIPSGVIIPIFIEDTLLGACVRPNGFYDSSEEFIIPGSICPANSCWFSHLSDSFYPAFLCENIGDAIRLNEETMHYLNSFAIAKPTDKLPEEFSKNLAEKNFILVPSKNGEEELEAQKWQSLNANIRVIPLGYYEDGREYTSLRERIASPESLEAWLQHYLPFSIEDPEYLSSEEYDAAFDNFMSEKLQKKPGKLNVDELRDKLFDEQQEKILDACPTKELKAKAKEALAKAKEEMHKFDNADDATIMKAHFEAQRNNLEQAKEALKNTNLKPNTDPDVPKNSMSILEGLSADLDANEKYCMDFYKQMEDLEEETLKIKAEIKELEEKSIEEKIKEYNLVDDDLVYLKASGILVGEDLFIDHRDYTDSDYSQMTFKNCSFNTIDFSGTNLSFCSFENCTFTNNIFKGCVLRGVKWHNSTFLKSILENGIAEENEFEGCEFLEARITELSLNKCLFKNSSLSSGQLSTCSLMACTIDNLNFFYTQLADVELLNCNFKDLSFSYVLTKKFSINHSFGEKLCLNNSKLEDLKLEESHIDRLELLETEALKAKFTGNSLQNVNLSESNFENSDMAKNVFTGLYAASSSFYESNFSYSVLKLATFTSCNLQKCVFLHANLFCSTLTESRLGQASFKEANLFGADFTGARILENDFTNANLKRTVLQSMSRHDPLSFKW